MGFTIPEAIADFPELLAFINKAIAGAQALPKPPAQVGASDVANLVASLLPDLGKLIDKIRAQAAD
jgi:hypothetical protein